MIGAWPQKNTRRAIASCIAAIGVCLLMADESAAIHCRAQRVYAGYPSAGYARSPVVNNPVGFGFGGYSYGGYPIYGYGGYLPSAYDGFGGVGFTPSMPVGLPGGYGSVGAATNVVVGYGAVGCDGNQCGPRWAYLRTANIAACVDGAVEGEIAPGCGPDCQGDGCVGCSRRCRRMLICGFRACLPMMGCYGGLFGFDSASEFSGEIIEESIEANSPMGLGVPEQESETIESIPAEPVGSPAVDHDDSGPNLERSL